MRVGLDVIGQRREVVVESTVDDGAHVLRRAENVRQISAPASDERATVEVLCDRGAEESGTTGDENAFSHAGEDRRSDPRPEASRGPGVRRRPAG